MKKYIKILSTVTTMLNARYPRRYPGMWSCAAGAFAAFRRKQIGHWDPRCTKSLMHAGHSLIVHPRRGRHGNATTGTSSWQK